MNTRKLFTLLIAFFAVLQLAATPAQAQKKPNVVVLMSDDTGWAALTV